MMKPLLIVSIAVLLGSFAFSGCDMLADKHSVESTVTDFHQKLDSGDFDAIYATTDDDFKAAGPKSDLFALLAAVHKKLGKIQSTSETNFSMNSVNLVTKVTLVYDTKFDGGNATETFIYRSSGNKQLLDGYNVNSLAMMEK